MFVEDGGTSAGGEDEEDEEDEELFPIVVSVNSQSKKYVRKVEFLHIL